MAKGSYCHAPQGMLSFDVDNRRERRPRRSTMGRREEKNTPQGKKKRRQGREMPPLSLLDKYICWAGRRDDDDGASETLRTEAIKQENTKTDKTSVNVGFSPLEIIKNS